jgi:uncharacterized membrane protein
MSSSLSATQPLSSGRGYPPPGRPEHAWPAFSSIIIAIVMQLLLPSRLTAGPKWIVPALEAVLLAGLVISTPTHVTGVHQARRRLALFLTGLVSVANITSLVLLSHALLQHGSPNPRALLSAGALIWLTNVIIFGLWYWETDRGGPGMRAAGRDLAPDFLFPQMSDDRIEPEGWRPMFVDYLYVSLTNALAFSPTDTMPLSSRAKGMMGLQSLASLVTIGLVVARAVNILP